MEGDRRQWSRREPHLAGVALPPRPKVSEEKWLVGNGRRGLVRSVVDGGECRRWGEEGVVEGEECRWGVVDGGEGRRWGV
jgi:hypothetical protein